MQTDLPYAAACPTKANLETSKHSAVGADCFTSDVTQRSLRIQRSGGTTTVRRNGRQKALAVHPWPVFEPSTGDPAEHFRVWTYSPSWVQSSVARFSVRNEEMADDETVSRYQAVHPWARGRHNA